MHALAEIELFDGIASDDEKQFRGRQRSGAKPQARVSLDNSPCTGCPMRSTCSSAPVACNHFYQWATRRIVKKEGRQFPTKAWYDRTMAHEGHDPS